MAPVGQEPPPWTEPGGALELELGVIKEAHRRRRLRRTRAGILAAAVAVVLGGAVWVLAGGPSRAAREVGPAAPILDPGGRPAVALNVRVFPMLSPTMAGWCEVVEEHGAAGVSACGGLPTSRRPFLQVLGWDQGRGPETQVAITDPQVPAILVDGKRRVATQPLPGLPYGLRAARVVARKGATIVALDREGRELTQQWGNDPRQTTTRSWHAPTRQPHGICALRASRLPGLSALGGVVARSVRPFAGPLVGSAFVPCAATTFSRHGVPLTVVVMLDAAHPFTRPAPLPNFHPVRRTPGVFAGGSLTARRSGNAWLMAEQGSNPAERILVLRHLNATIARSR